MSIENKVQTDHKNSALAKRQVSDGVSLWHLCKQRKAELLIIAIALIKNILPHLCSAKFDPTNIEIFGIIPSFACRALSPPTLILDF